MSLVGPVAGGLTIDGDAGEWLDKPPSLLLQPLASGARSGRVWLAESEDGLIVAGRVGGPTPSSRERRRRWAATTTSS